jgi:hypothetical protein
MAAPRPPRPAPTIMTWIFVRMMEVDGEGVVVYI